MKTCSNTLRIDFIVVFDIEKNEKLILRVFEALYVDNGPVVRLTTETINSHVGTPVDLSKTVPATTRDNFRFLPYMHSWAGNFD